jgi:hypothetical protein
VSGPTVEEGEWNHFAGTYDGASMKLHLNGELVAQESIHQIPRSTNDALTIGYSGFHQFFNGNLEGALVFNKALDHEQVRLCMEETQPFKVQSVFDFEPVFFWDKGLSSHEITWTGQLGENNYFNGVDCFGSTPSTDELKLGQNHTIMLWVRPHAIPSDWARLVGKGNVEHRNYGTWLNSQRHALYQFKDIHGNWGNIDKGTVNLNEWSHFAGTFDGSTMKLYLNGVVVTSSTNVQPCRTSNEPLTLGYSGFHSHFQGNMDAVFIFNKTLSSHEIKRCMEETRPQQFE